MKNAISAWDELKSEDELDEDLVRQEFQPANEGAEVIADGDEDRIAGIALAVPEVIATHALLGRPITGSIAERRRSSHLIFGGTRRFCPEVNTLNL